MLGDVKAPKISTGMSQAILARPEENNDILMKEWLERYLDIFYYNELNTTLGITFNEFINQPRWVVETMVEKSNEWKIKKIEEQQEVVRRVEEERKMMAKKGGKR